MTGSRVLRAVLTAGLMLTAGGAGAAVAREDIVVLGADGRSYTSYTTLRSELPRRQFLLPAGATPDDYLYIHPSDFQHQATDAGTRLTFTGGGYALMRTGRFDEERLTARGNGRYTFHSWDGRELDNGHFGKWNAPDAFADFAYVWVVPGNIELLEYRCNRAGEWRHKGNTLVWTGHDVNDLTFRITYRRTGGTLPPARPAEAAAGGSERITLDAAVLFPPGSHELTDRGLAALDGLAGRIRRADPARVIVTGHTDDQPLKPYLRERYPSNWELSAARATNVVRELVERGVAPGLLEARARGAQQPVASNDTAAGRARNRRIEVELIGADGQRNADRDSASAPAATEEEEEAEEIAPAATGARAPSAFLR